jgi:hypothetical protein
MVDREGTGLAGVDGLTAIGFDKIEPNARGAIRAYRNLGYKLNDALADLIDNSIDAEAKHVLIRFIYTPDAVARVVIADDGHGMTENGLRSAMQFGVVEKHASSDLGKYGMGMKTASFSQAKCLSVITRHDKKVAARQWTERDINKGWACGRLNIPAATKLLDERWSGLKLARSGTLIVWDDVDRMEPRHDDIQGYLDNKLRFVAIALGLVFHRIIKARRIKISLERQKLNKSEPDSKIVVEPVDPFAYPEPGNRHYPRAFTFDLGRLGKVKGVAHIWPARAKGPEYSLGGKAAAGQGFYFYRNDRLIQAGGWNGIRQQEDEPHLTLARIAVDLPPRLDSEFALQTQKSGVDAPGGFAEAVRSSSAGKLTWTDYIRDAQQAYRKSPEIKYPVVPGRGFPVAVRSRSKQLFANSSRRKGFTQFSIAWTELEPGQFFEIDRVSRVISINRDYRVGLKSRAGDDGAIFKTLLFVLLREDLESKNTKKKEAWLSACNRLLAAAYGVR